MYHKHFTSWFGDAYFFQLLAAAVFKFSAYGKESLNKGLYTTANLPEIALAPANSISNFLVFFVKLNFQRVSLSSCYHVKETISAATAVLALTDSRMSIERKDRNEIKGTLDTYKRGKERFEIRKTNIKTLQQLLKNR